MTEKLYYHDPTLTEFRTRLLRQERTETPDGPRWRALLAASCFYPGGGGQPCDRGTLNDRDVLEVLKEGEDLLHLLEAPLTEDQEVHGRIDPLYRRHYMQQHTGQHILSAVLQRRCGYPTRSVHLGEEASSIEIEGTSITGFEIIEVEDEANRIICENRPVHAFFVSREELPALELRRSLKTDSDIRVVEISGLDQVGCGGVHLERTGGVRLVKHLATEKVRGNSRLLFAIGDRAMADYREKSRISARLSALLSAPLNEISTRLEEYVEKNLETERRTSTLLKERNTLLAAELYREGDSFGGGRIITAELPSDCAESLREIAEALLSRGPCHLLLAVRDGNRLRWIVGTSDGDPQFFDRLKPVLLPLIGGKGGGRHPFWQGAGENPEGADEFLEAFRREMAGKR